MGALRPKEKQKPPNSSFMSWIRHSRTCERLSRQVGNCGTRSAVSKGHATCVGGLMPAAHPAAAWCAVRAGGGGELAVEGPGHRARLCRDFDSCRLPRLAMGGEGQTAYVMAL